MQQKHSSVPQFWFRKMHDLSRFIFGTHLVNAFASPITFLKEYTMKHQFFSLMVFIVAASALAFAKGPLQKNQGQQGSLGIPQATLMNINNISSWYKNNGESERNPATGNSGLTFPRGTSTAVYSSGLMFGAISTDGIQSGPRVTGHSYNSGFAPGAILGLRTGIVESASDPNVRIWRIRRDYAVADLKQDAAEYFMKSLTVVTAEDILAIRDQYKKDWQEWPASKGAPFYDANNDGIYTPQFETVDGKEVPKVFPQADEPGIAKGDQVIWYVCNDIANGDSPWKTKPMGLEQQVTIWGYNSSSKTGNILYKKFKVVYKGTSQTPVGSKLENAYITHWSDYDIGDAGDDFAGCDTLLSLGYGYNSKTLDSEYRKFNLIPPALGYDFLQGPIVPSSGDTAVFDLKKRVGYKNLSMTSFIYFASGDMYTDPPFNFNGSIQWYQMMRGLPPFPQGPPDPAPVNNPVTNKPTGFWYSGDPVLKTGWIDGRINSPGDRRIVQSSGPFTMALGDTQEIVVGVVMAIGDDFLNSITKMKENDRYVQFMYNSLFELVPPSVSATVTYPNSTNADIALKGVGQAGKFTSLFANIKGTSVQLFDDGTHNDGSASDGVFANSTSINRSLIPNGIDITFTDSNNKTHSIQNAVENLTTAGSVDVTSAPVIFDNINNNGTVNNGEYVHYTITIKNNTPFTLTGVKGTISTNTEFAKEYSFGSIASGSESAVPNDKFFTFRLPMNYSAPNYNIDLTFSDENGNLWKSSWSFPVVHYASVADSLSNIAANIVGNNDGQVGYVLYEPSIAGQVFDIWYGGNNLTRDWTVVKNLPNSDYASVTANLSALKQIPAITTLPNAKGTGTFTLNDAKDQLTYSISASGLSGSITAAHIHLGSSSANGLPVKTLTFSGTTAAGVWAKNDATDPFADSLFKKLIAGELYVNIHTAANPGGEIRGQISDGMNLRQSVDMTLNPVKPIFSNVENRFSGFSLFIGRAKAGTKSVQQTSPTIGNVLNTPNPENSYRVVDSLLQNFLNPSKIDESTIELQFNNDVNWAIAVPAVTNPIPAQSYYVKVPFAVFKDTVRIFPVVVDKNSDTIWNTTANPTYLGKPLFDNIRGIVDTKDANNNDIRYYSSAFPSFPPTSTVIKARLVNGINHLLTNILFTNEAGNNTAPPSGTKIIFNQYQSIKAGDIKSITLKTLGVSTEQLSVIPHDYSLSQNYPNPFNPSTNIEFALPRQSHVSLKVYDVIGREVATLFSEEKSAGRFTVRWNGKNNNNQLISSGIYFYRLEAGNFVQTKKMILIK